MKNTTTGLICFYFFYALTYINQLYAQDIEDYNTLYSKTYLETVHKDFPRALHVADSLYSISETPELQAKSLMLTASLYQQKGEIIKSIEYAVKAEKIIKATSDVNWKTRIYGFLATQYRIARLFTPAKAYIEKATATAKNIKEQQPANTTMGFINQEMAYHEMAQKQYKKAIAHIQQAKQYFKDIEQNRDFFAVENEQLLGLNYYLLDDDSTALKHYEIALDLSTNIPENHIIALIYNGLSNIYLNKDQPSKAKKYLDDAQLIADKSHYLHLKKEVYETAYRYYTHMNDISQILLIKTKHDSVLSQIYRNSADFLNNSYTLLGHEREKLEQQSRSTLAFLLMGVLIVLPIILYFVLPQPKQKPINNNFSNKSKDSELVPIVEKEEEKENEGAISPTIPEQVVDKIMIHLEEFEKKHLYIESDVSLSHLAIYCDTNAKYLSIVINSHKKKDFYNYINELRINYIVEKLISDPYYKKLKVAVLAREAGFSSQSKFAVHFKKVTSISPSEFIRSLPDTGY